MIDVILLDGHDRRQRFNNTASATIHVDDMVVAAVEAWLDYAYRRFMANLDQRNRQRLPFANVGVDYTRLDDGGISLMQVAYADAIQIVRVGAEVG